MPAFAEEVEAAIQEGIKVEPYVSPLRVEPQEGGTLGLLCIKNRPGERETDGRKKPIPEPGGERA